MPTKSTARPSPFKIPPGPLTLEQAHQIMDRHAAEIAKQDAVATSRQQYVAKNMMGLPKVYRELLQSNNPDDWQHEEMEIRDRYRDDLKKLNFMARDIGGDSDGAAVSPLQTGWLGNLTAQEKLALGLAASKAAQRPKR
jgi:hypothetical protein